MTEFNADLDREELHETLQNRDFIGFIDMLRGQDALGLARAFQEFGEEVKQEADHELMIDLKEPLQIDDGLLGCLALMYEAENQILLEEELADLDSDLENRAEAMDD